MPVVLGSQTMEEGGITFDALERFCSSHEQTYAEFLESFMYLRKEDLKEQKASVPKVGSIAEDNEYTLAQSEVSVNSVQKGGELLKDDEQASFELEAHGIYKLAINIISIYFEIRKTIIMSRNLKDLRSATILCYSHFVLLSSKVAQGHLEITESELKILYSNADIVFFTEQLSRKLHLKIAHVLSTKAGQIQSDQLPPISLLSIISKVMEDVVDSAIKGTYSPMHAAPLKELNTIQDKATRLTRIPSTMISLCFLHYCCTVVPSTKLQQLTSASLAAPPKPGDPYHLKGQGQQAQTASVSEELQMVLDTAICPSDLMMEGREVNSNICGISWFSGHRHASPLSHHLPVDNCVDIEDMESEKETKQQNDTELEVLPGEIEEETAADYSRFECKHTSLDFKVNSDVEELNSKTHERVLIDEVQPFTLDEDFDYDCVHLKPKYTEAELKTISALTKQQRENREFNAEKLTILPFPGAVNQTA
ncbi:uncharacterized protein iftap [Heterodontus francisci]|uniref:uncharacterized protein iftap n=1 Tax=Heterodontus francisci TaxID=7792 RepID=UPI00355BE7A3